MKPLRIEQMCVNAVAFSILERIDVGETHAARTQSPFCSTFSILERIDVGETQPWRCPRRCWRPFSILERIDVGETIRAESEGARAMRLSVSSNGSTWVKPRYSACMMLARLPFQYPRTDRRG